MNVLISCVCNRQKSSFFVGPDLGALALLSCVARRLCEEPEAIRSLIQHSLQLTPCPAQAGAKPCCHPRPPVPLPLSCTSDGLTPFVYNHHTASVAPPGVQHGKKREGLQTGAATPWAACGCSSGASAAHDSKRRCLARVKPTSTHGGRNAHPLRLRRCCGSLRVRTHSRVCALPPCARRAQGCWRAAPVASVVASLQSDAACRRGPTQGPSTCATQGMSGGEASESRIRARIHSLVDRRDEYSLPNATTGILVVRCHQERIAET